MPLADVGDAIADVAEILKPPRRLTVAESAEKYIWLDIPGGYNGPWKNDLPYYMVEPAACLTDRKIQAVIFAGPAQSAKTQVLVDNWFAHNVICDPTDMMIVQTAKDTARDFSKRRIDRLINSTKALKSRLRGGGSDDNTFDKVFKAGNILSLAWPTKNQLAGKAIPKMALTDYDRMDDNVDGDGPAFTLAFNRTKTFLSRGMTMAESSPSKPILDPKWKPKTAHEAPPTKGILGLYNTGDRRRLYGQCPHCEEYFTPKISIDAFFIPDLPDLSEAALNAELICTECGTGISQLNNDARTFKKSGIWLKEGQRISKTGVISGEGLKSRRASFWMPGWFAGFQPWDAIIYNYLTAKYEHDRTGEEEGLQGVVNTDIGGAYLPLMYKNSGVDADTLADRASEYNKYLVPKGVRFLVGTADVQKNRFVVQVIGYGVGLENWLVDRYSIAFSERTDDNGELAPLNPAGYLEDWRVLEQKMIGRTYELDDGSARLMPVKIVLCDSGGSKDDYSNSTVTKNAYDYWRLLRKKGKHQHFHLIKGRATGPSVEKTFPDSSNRKDRNSGARGDVPVQMLNSNTLKDIVAADLERSVPGAGFMNFPHWLKKWFYQEVTAETRTAKGWENKAKKRNEAFDLYTYGRAGCKILKADRIDWQSPPAWARDWDDNIDIIDPSDKAQDTGPVKKARGTRFRF
jgi:phage terminase large subunit GpA-like protein